MRRTFGLGILLVVACRHAGAPVAPPGAAAGGADARCDARRAENRRRAAVTRCVADADCAHAGAYETGTCGAWVAGPGAARLLAELREAADAACRDAGVRVRPACLPVAATCVSGRCSARAAGRAEPAEAAVPEDPRCLADALLAEAGTRDLPAGRVELRFPLAADGSPARWFEAVGPVDPDAAAAVARACSACRWRLAAGGAIPPGSWGSITLGLRE